MSTTNTLPPMRGIQQAYNEIKASDADTALSLKGLRTLVITGCIPSVRIGNKYLINMDVLKEYLSKGCSTVTAAPTNSIRKIDERISL